jgi:hypothetical protein
MNRCLLLAAALAACTTLLTGFLLFLTTVNGTADGYTVYGGSRRGRNPVGKGARLLREAFTGLALKYPPHGFLIGRFRQRYVIFADENKI